MEIDSLQEINVRSYRHKHQCIQANGTNSMYVPIKFKTLNFDLLVFLYKISMQITISYIDCSWLLQEMRFFKFIFQSSSYSV